MKKKWIVVALLIGFSWCQYATAQSSGGDFTIASSTIDGGGGVSSGGNFTLTGTIGQPDASTQISSGSGFLLASGFWTQIIEAIFSDGFEQ